MATQNIIVNDYELPEGIAEDAVKAAILNFNVETVKDYCDRYIGTDKTCNRSLVKKIAALGNYVYMIRFTITKTNEVASILYELSCGDQIIYNNQEYTTIEEFDNDINFINDNVNRIFTRNN